MKVLLTGATGSIGKELVPALLGKGYALGLLVRDAQKVSVVFKNYNIQHVVVIDVNKDNWAKSIIDFDPSVVIHLASLITSKDDFDIIPGLIESNITFGAQLLQSLKATRVSLFINTGTFAEYFYGDGQYDPSYLYSATKTAFHSILKYYQQLIAFKLVNVIPYTVYGQFDSQPKIIDIIYNSFFSAQPVGMSGGMQTLDFIHIEDVVLFYCLLIERHLDIKLSWQNYHLGTGVGTTLRRIAEIVSAEIGLPENINWGALAYRPRDTMHSIAPTAKMLHDFNWKPAIDIISGVKKYISKK